MDFEKVLKERFSVRKFEENKEIEEEKIQKILEAGRIAPTAKNLQPQKIYVIKSEEAKEKLDKVCPCRFKAPVTFLICSDKDIAWESPFEEYSSFEMDATICATQMMLETTNLGLGSCFVRHFDSREVKKIFEIPNNITPICLLPIGYIKEECPINPLHYNRKNIEEIVKYL